MGKATSHSKKITTSSRIKLNKEDKSIEYIILVLLSVFIIIIPFYRGLFFRENYIPAITFVSMLYLAYLVYKLLHKNYNIIDTYLDLAVLAIPICYYISFLFGVNAKDGFDAILIYSSYFMIYRIASSLCRVDDKIKNILIHTIIASTFVTAFASLLVLAKVIDLKGVISGNRLFGLYQYPNTTASVLAIGIILVINELINTKNIKLKLIYQVILTTLLSTFIFTLSRGAFLAIAGVLFLNFLLIDGQGKLSLVLNLLISFLPNSIFIYKYYTQGQAEYGSIMANYIMSIAAVLALTYIYHILNAKYLKNISIKTINISLTATVLIFAAVLAFLLSIKEPIQYKVEHLAGEEKSWKSSWFYIENVEKSKDYILEFDVMSSLENPYSYGVIIRSYKKNNEFDEIYREFSSVGSDFIHKRIQFTTLEDTERLRFILYNYETDSYTVYTNVVLKDGMGNIIKKQERFKYIPDAIVKRFENIKLDDNSASSRVRFIKDGIEIFKDNILIGAGGGGWKNLYRQYQSIPYNTTEVHNFYVQYAIEVGILGLIPLAAILILLLNDFVKCIKNKSDYLPIYLAAFLMLMHSTIDFNLSLVAVAYLLWVLIGILNTNDVDKQLHFIQKRWIHISFIVLSIVILVFSSSIAYAINIGNKAAELMNSDVDQSMKLYEKAMKLDRYNSDYRADYAQIMSYKFRETNDDKYYNKMLEQISRIEKYEPYNYKYTSVLISLLASNGMFDEAINMAETKLKNEPFVVQSYIIKADLNYEIAKYYFENRQHGKAIPYLENMIEARKQFDEANAKLEIPMKLPKDYNMKTELAQNWIEQAKKIEKRKSK